MIVSSIIVDINVISTIITAYQIAPSQEARLLI